MGTEFYTYLEPKDYVAVLVLVLKVTYFGEGNGMLGLKYFTKDYTGKAVIAENRTQMTHASAISMVTEFPEPIQAHCEINSPLSTIP